MLKIEQVFNYIINDQLGMFIMTLENNPEIVNATDSFGNTLIHIAACYNRPEIIYLLIERWKVNPNIKNQNGLIPFSLSLRKGYKKCVDLFFKYNTDVTIKNADNLQPLHIALKYNQYEILKEYLLPAIYSRLGEENINEWKNKYLLPCDSLNQTPLHYGAYNDATESLSILINENIDVNIQDIYGSTPILIVSQFGTLKTFILFIDKADINIKNNMNQNILHILVRYNKLEILQFLIDKFGYEKIKHLLHTKDKLGITPLLEAKIRMKDNNKSKNIYKILSDLYSLYELKIDDKLDHQDFNCPICKSIFYHPINLCCGHIFCFPCISLAMQNGFKCPICQYDLKIRNISIKYNNNLEELIKKIFPNEWKEREEEMKTDSFENTINNIQYLITKYNYESFFLDHNLSTSISIDGIVFILKFVPIRRELVVTSITTNKFDNEIQECEKILEFKPEDEFHSLYYNNKTVYHIDINMEGIINENKLYNIMNSFINFIKGNIKRKRKDKKTKLITSYNDSQLFIEVNKNKSRCIIYNILSNVNIHNINNINKIRLYKKILNTQLVYWIRSKMISEKRTGRFALLKNKDIKLIFYITLSITNDMKKKEIIDKAVSTYNTEYIAMLDVWNSNQSI